MLRSSAGSSTTKSTRIIEGTSGLVVSWSIDSDRHQAGDALENPKFFEVGRI